MGTKKITDLQLRGSISDDLNFPSDDSLQSYRVTALMIKNWILTAGNITRAILAAGAVGRKQFVTNTTTATVAANIDVVYGDTTGGAFSSTLTAGATYGTGHVMELVKTSADNTAWTIDGNSSEQIGGAATTALHTQGEKIRIMWNGTAWDILERIIPSKVIAFTPSGSWVANTNYTGKKWRVGDRAHYEVKVACVGAPTATGLTINQPSGETIDTAKLASTVTSVAIVGELSANDSGGGYAGVVLYASSTTVGTNVFGVSGTWATYGSLHATQPFTFGTGDEVTLKWSVPISGWNS